jgi:hypothetical protein
MYTGNLLLSASVTQWDVLVRNPKNRLMKHSCTLSKHWCIPSSGDVRTLHIVVTEWTLHITDLACARWSLRLRLTHTAVTEVGGIRFAC